MGVIINGQMPCRASFYAGGLEEGAGRQTAEYLGVCVFGETTGETLTADGRTVQTAGKAVIDGDAAPNLCVIYGGEFTVETPGGERRMAIARARRVRAGSRRVRHTVLDLI